MASDEEKLRLEEEKAIELFKIKKLIASLQRAKGAGTSMISLIMPPRSQISITAKMLSDEYGTASNIKSRVNRQSVLTAITSAQQRLKLYNRCPENGLVVYCGEVMTDDGKIRKVSIDFEPFRPINTSLYMCDNKFHTDALSELLQASAAVARAHAHAPCTRRELACASWYAALLTSATPTSYPAAGRRALRLHRHGRQRLALRHHLRQHARDPP
jgi:hypothetical protein